MPDWVTPYFVRRMLWQDYGISIPLDEDSAYEDVMNMLLLNASMARRNSRQQESNSKQMMKLNE